MANILDIQNILEKAKKGQYISINCQSTSADFDATVVQLGTDKVQSVKAEDWEEGWPEEATSDIKYGTTITTGGVWRSSDGCELTATHEYDPTHQNPIYWKSMDLRIELYDYDTEFAEAQGIPPESNACFYLEIQGCSRYIFQNKDLNYEKIIEFKDDNGITWTWSAS